MKKLLILFFILVFTTQAGFSQQTVVTSNTIPFDWGSADAAAFSNEVMAEVLSNLPRYEFYHISFQRNNNSATSFWRNEVIFETRRNPSTVTIEMVFNYFSIKFWFSNESLSLGGTEFSESWFRGLVAQNRFRRELGEVINRISMTMRGMTFGNNSRRDIDRRRLEALRLPMV